jgi:hypothetical protein
MLFTAGVSSNLCLSLSLVGKRVHEWWFFNGYTCIFCFSGVWEDSWSGRGRLEGGICEMRLSPR